jgi:hypothetical protein
MQVTGHYQSVTESPGSLQELQRSRQADVVSCSSLMHGCVLGGVWQSALQLMDQFSGCQVMSDVDFGRGKQWKTYGENHGQNMEHMEKHGKTMEHLGINECEKGFEVLFAGHYIVEEMTGIDDKDLDCEWLEVLPAF